MKKLHGKTLRVIGTVKVGLQESTTSNKDSVSPSSANESKCVDSKEFTNSTLVNATAALCQEEVKICDGGSGDAVQSHSTSSSPERVSSSLEGESTPPKNEKDSLDALVEDQGAAKDLTSI